MTVMIQYQLEWKGAATIPPRVVLGTAPQMLREAGRNALSGPPLIVSASGMTTCGRVLPNLKALAPDARNAILLP